MAGWALILAIIGILWNYYNTSCCNICQKDTDDHNRRLDALEKKLKDKGII